MVILLSVLTAAALLLAACRPGAEEATDAPSPEARLTSRAVVQLKSLGPISIGMTLEQLERAAGVGMIRQPDYDEAIATDNCAYVSPETIPGYVPPPGDDPRSPIAFMISSNQLVRIDFLDPTFATSDGVRVGSSEKDVLDAYGGGQSPPPDRGFIGEPYRYLKASPQDQADREFRMVFESDGAKVVKYYIGKLPHVEYKNGCKP